MKFRDVKDMDELAELDGRIKQIHLLIIRQRQLIEELDQNDETLASAEIMFESLRMSLFLSLQDRHRLRTRLDIKSPEFEAA